MKEYTRQVQIIKSLNKLKADLPEAACQKVFFAINDPSHWFDWIDLHGQHVAKSVDIVKTKLEEIP